MRVQSLRPEFVEFIPKSLEDGVIYISKKYRTASHRCCCGRGTRIVTPLRPTEYELFERGELVSLRPSIGNWDHPCQSHYLITDNRVVWAPSMSEEQIRRGRQRDEELKQAYFRRVAWPWWRKVASWVGQQWRRVFG